MRLDLFGKNERLDQRKQVETQKNSNSKEHNPETDFEATAENNLYAKAVMVTELVEMGFSLEAIERILNLESEVLDRIL
jgi:hypothetical protein